MVGFYDPIGAKNLAFLLGIKHGDSPIDHEKLPVMNGTWTWMYPLAMTKSLRTGVFFHIPIIHGNLESYKNDLSHYFGKKRVDLTFGCCQKHQV